MHTKLDNLEKSKSDSMQNVEFPESIELVVKISERCNLACTYCYFFFHKDRSYESHSPTIREDTVTGLCNFARMAAESGVKQIDFILHGGEPLMLKRKRFDSMCLAISKTLNGLCEYRFNLQTNATLITDDWVDTFVKWNVGVGISLDGNEERNDENRIDLKGRGTYRNTVRGLKMLQAAHSENRLQKEPGLLSVVDPLGSGKAAYRHFVDDLGFRRINFLLLDETHDSITPKVIEGTERFMIEAFDEWTKDNRTDIHFRFFSDLIICLCSDEMMETYSPYREDVSRIFTISSDGGVGLDDVMRSLGGRYAEEKYTVFENRIEDILDDSPLTEVRHVIHKYKPPACEGCDWWKLCRGGRINTRFSESNEFERETVYCSALKNIYGHVVSYLIDNGVSGDDIVRRLSLN